jgi:hypothetical protein
MLRRLVPALVLVAFVAPAFAEDKADAKNLKGTWLREVNNSKISFEFKDEKTFRCIIQPDGAADGPVIDCEYTLDKDGTMNFAITDIDKKGLDNLPNKGDKFSFKVEVSKDKLTISELKGTDDEGAKGLVQGDYMKK